MVFDDDLDAVEERIDNWQADLVERARRARDLADRVQQLTFEASVADDAIIAVINHSGQLIDPTVKDRVREWPGDKIALAILGTQRAAQQALAQHMRELAAAAGFRAAS